MDRATATVRQEMDFEYANSWRQKAGDAGCGMTRGALSALRQSPPIGLLWAAGNDI
jgi:hypothetical protein